MKNWIIGGLLGACIGVWLYLALIKHPESAPAAIQEPPAVAASPAAPAPAVVLAEVVEVTNIDPLLDPPSRPVIGVPFDAEPVAAPVSAAAPERIPPAVD
jgi:hypothetical protein